MQRGIALQPVVGQALGSPDPSTLVLHPSGVLADHKGKPSMLACTESHRMPTRMAVALLIRLSVIALTCSSLACCISLARTGRRYERPQHTQHAAMARWLVAESDWGTVSTNSRHLAGAPFGNVVSYSDGVNSTGRLLFYLTALDATAADLEEDDRATLTVGEIQQEGSCGIMDPEDPTCAKVSISGRMGVVPEQGVREAEEMLFQRHPQMRDWPKGHNFRVYELRMETARLLDFYGGAATVKPQEYFAARLRRAQSDVLLQE